VRVCVRAKVREGKSDTLSCTVELIQTIVMELVLVCVVYVCMCVSACVRVSAKVRVRERDILS